MGGSLPVHGRPVDPPVSFKPDSRAAPSPTPLKNSSRALFLSAAILANLLLGSSDESADEAEYGAPAVDSYGAPAQEYAEPAPSYDAPAPTYEEPAPAYEEPAAT